MEKRYSAVRAFGADSRHALIGSKVVDLVTGAERPIQRGENHYRFPGMSFAHHMANYFKGFHVSPDGTRYIAGYLAREATIRPVGNAAVTLATLKVDRTKVISVRFSRDGRFIATGLTDRSVRIWDATTYQQVGMLPADPHSDIVLSVDFSPDGTRIATGCRDTVVRLFDAKTYELVMELEGHISHIASVLFSPDGSRLASASGDATVRIWDTVPRHVRNQQARAAAALRAEMAPLVDRLSRGFGDPVEVARRLRSDASLGEAQRKAALHLMMRRVWSRK
jgi:hypothetical protein